MMAPRIIRECLGYWSSQNDGMDVPVTELLEELDIMLSETPADHTAMICLDTESDYDGPSIATLTVYYDREETAEDIAKAEAAQRTQIEAEAARRAERDRQEYERLKHKFEGT